jgi:hypothetical protein
MTTGPGEAIRQRAEAMVREHGSADCRGHFVPEEPFCSVAPTGHQLCPSCQALADEIAALLRESAVLPPREPQDTYNWGEPMPQYAVLGNGVEAWVELEQEERRGIERRCIDKSGMSISWRTLRLVMHVLRAVKLRHFREESATPRLASPGAEALRALVAKWRETGKTQRAEWLLCADDLDAALGQAEARAPQEECTCGDGSDEVCWRGHVIAGDCFGMTPDPWVCHEFSEGERCSSKGHVCEQHTERVADTIERAWLAECDRRSRAVEAPRHSGLDHVVDLPDKHPLRIRAEKAERERDAMRVALQLIDRGDVDETRWDLIKSALASPAPAAEDGKT